MSITPEPLSFAEKQARLRLIRTDNVGPVTFRQLISRYKSAEKAIEILPELAKRGGRKKPLVACSMAKINKELDDLDQNGGELIVLGDTLYPALLAATEDSPPIMMALGHTHLLEQNSFAIVGARNSSVNGLKIARNFAEKLGQAGYVISSGMARGIDAAAHQGAINTGTIAVLAGGADVIYPRENTETYHAIKETGLILSEMPFGTQPQARHFPRRNRIISGLSLGVLVVEANHKSGTLITARLASEQGREVFAIPGSPLDPRAKGPNSLIRQGAQLTESVEDILEVLNIMSGRQLSEPQFDLFHSPPATEESDNELEKAMMAIKEKLSHTATSVDELIRLTDLSPSVVQTVLLDMELAGEITRHAGNRVSFC
ncbi:DNA-processing protein DprA [Pseudemcibacter aquimaris]|uniref:DNA-processing protein DprA n=1 Tax=Pseudemcibacter aquimaris TaxID=2857064 RepID=UPI002011681B|nr:DNA-processing protein DprA [Pseudemcibacter aquimaris]MCC3860493.1 DNA-processing protein DprA [Pseudemcibacter aquimaris]WDU59318.1 DNA-processing protein DprA [Pseudemcibacter aquimaris]